MKPEFSAVPSTYEDDLPVLEVVPHPYLASLYQLQGAEGRVAGVVVFLRWDIRNSYEIYILMIGKPRFSC